MTFQCGDDPSCGSYTWTNGLCTLYEQAYICIEGELYNSVSYILYNIISIKRRQIKKPISVNDGVDWVINVWIVFTKKILRRA